MRCDEFEERWHDGLDRRVDLYADAELSLHLETCAGCRGWATSLRRALLELDALPKPAPRDDLSRRVLAELASSEATPENVAASLVELSPRRSAVSHSRGWHWWALAAMLLVSVVPLWRWAIGKYSVSPNDGDGVVAVPGGTAAPLPSEQIVVSPAPATPPLATPEAGPTESMPTDFVPTWSDVAEGSRESARQLADNTRRSLHDAFALASLWEAKPEAERGDSEDVWYRGVADGVAPLTDSTLGTFNVLRGVVPTDKEASL